METNLSICPFLLERGRKRGMGHGGWEMGEGFLKLVRCMALHSSWVQLSFTVRNKYYGLYVTGHLLASPQSNVLTKATVG